mmetsp:Transcript_81858/g.213083  ORF Transcript_81858/g.213083 Transcript_81858/m.213083 type:complete len:204 (-) Transcript_81858:12-623(-)
MPGRPLLLLRWGPFERVELHGLQRGSGFRALGALRAQLPVHGACWRCRVSEAVPYPMALLWPDPEGHRLVRGVGGSAGCAERAPHLGPARVRPARALGVRARHQLRRRPLLRGCRVVPQGGRFSATTWRSAQGWQGLARGAPLARHYASALGLCLCSSLVPTTGHPCQHESIQHPAQGVFKAHRLDVRIGTSIYCWSTELVST